MKAKTNEVISGQVYNCLTLTGNYQFIETSVGKRMVVEAVCICGVVKNYPLRYLKTGNTKSCGCERTRKLRESKITHNLSRHPLYSVYQDIQHRCYNPKCKAFKDYGARGIMCEWTNVKDFCEWGDANGYKKGLEIDRRDNDGNYRPDNCRFVTRAVGSTNTRRTHKISAFGETKTIAEWTRDERCSISEHALLDRLKSHKWKVEEAITSPSNNKKKELARSSNSAKIIEVWGEKKSLIEWSEDYRCTVGYSGLKQRIKRGWSYEKAISFSK